MIHIIAFAMCVMVIIGATGCQVTVMVTPALVAIDAGKTASLQATSTSSQDTSFAWTSADVKIATVDETGTVTGVGEGQTTVTAQGSSSGAQGHAAITVNRPAGALSKFGITIDTTIVPASATLPSYTQGGPGRPLAAVVDEFGHQTEFVEDELLLVTDDAAALAAFVARWGGEVLATVDPTGSGMNMPQTHLVRINTALGDPSHLNSDVLTLDPNSRGASRVSSDAGLRLISASAKEAVAGLKVGINWVARGSSLADGGSVEASTGPNGFNVIGSNYSPYTIDWSYLDGGSTQDIGVTKAWQLLARAHKLKNKVKVAILDMGFSVDGNWDVPSGLTAVSNVPFTDPLGTQNLLSCTGGSPCPYHGTETTSAAMAVPDNNFGSAGPGGPVAQPVLIFTLYDFFTSIAAITEAGLEGASVVNMSYGAGVPAALFFTVIPFDLATSVASQFMVLCAAAGNDNRNVDSQDCFIVCWEDTWWTPCENDGVFCVGALRQNSLYRADYSNYGNANSSGDVDIFAPGTVIVGPDPSSGISGGRSESGTSFSSPFVAGVAALMLAANPSMAPSDVTSLLLDQAHFSPDNDVLKVINAYDSVWWALPPSIGIDFPQDGATIHGGFPVQFTAYMHLRAAGPANLQWSSSLDGNLGAPILDNDFDDATPFTTTAKLSYGTHVITVVATFTNETSEGHAGATIQDAVTVTVVNDPPTVTITSPTDGASYFQGQPVLLAGTSVDINEPTGHLSDSQVSWFVDGAQVATGHTFTIAAGTLSVGPHTIRFVGSDGSLSDSKTVGITTNPNPVNLPPDQVNITSPTQGAELLSLFPVQFDSGGYYINLTVAGNAHDPEDGTLTGASLSWTMKVDDAPPVDLGTGTSITKKVYVGAGQTPYVFTLTATDSGGSSSSVTIHTVLTLILK